VVTSVALRRRQLLFGALALGGAATLGAACQGLPVPPAPTATLNRPEQLSAGDAPRERTLILANGPRKGTAEHAWNPYAATGNHQNGSGWFYEPLFYYSAFANRWIPWLAESFQYSPDYREMTITLRSGITWSDGTPFSADDVVYTLETLRTAGTTIARASAVRQAVQQADADGPTRVRIRFQRPTPKFHYVLAYEYDQGLFIVPRHVFQQQSDWSTFEHYDPDKSWPLTTGPWRLGTPRPGRTTIKRAANWWAASAGLTALPAVEQVNLVPFVAEPYAALGLRTNQFDSTASFGVSGIRTVLEENDAIITHTNREPPFGYVDGWPISMFLATRDPVYGSADVRRAINAFVDRRALIARVYGGAGRPSLLPMPAYAGLAPFYEAAQPLLDKHAIGTFDAELGARLLTARGFQRQDGMWTRDGAALRLRIAGLSLFADLGPALAEQLKQQGIAARYVEPADPVGDFKSGQFEGLLLGNAGSTADDPYFTLRLYQANAQGRPSTLPDRFSTWQNDDFDALVDQLAGVPSDDQRRSIALFVDAIKIWLEELPSVPLVEWIHRIPMNTAFWQGWPTSQDPYVNSAFWHLTFPLVLNRLRPRA
jgi:peptide/nickel transport system substrate-binding protein